MIKIGLIREGKIPEDNRVALIPSQCKWLMQNKDVAIIVQRSETRCYRDADYTRLGIEVKEDLSECDILFGIKEVPVEMLIPQKVYLFFSHTRKLQSYNQRLFIEIVRRKITLIDYECLEHADGTRLIGFGFFAGVVGAHNGMMAYGNRSGKYKLNRVFEMKDFKQLIHTYFGLKLPPLKIAITGSGRVGHGILEIMNLMGIHETEPEDFKNTEFPYPVYVHLKGGDLYKNRLTETYIRKEFHEHPGRYECLFKNYLSQTDILMNGIYWEKNIPRLFEMDDLKQPGFRIKTIADISDDKQGSVPCNLGDNTIEDPIYGVDKLTGTRTAPYVDTSVDVMAVGNLPNELPRDASRYFGEQLIKYILDDLISGGSKIIEDATITRNGNLTEKFQYMREYAGGL